jgi:uncharacterized protein involved in exopolysaccharide biosynthesis
VTSANALILKRIVDKPSPEVESALRRLANALNRPSSTATDGDVWPRPPKAASAALADLKSHYADVRKQIADVPQIPGEASQQRRLLAALDAQIQALDQFEAALFPRTGFSAGQTQAFKAAQESAAKARDGLSQAMKGLSR